MAIRIDLIRRTNDVKRIDVRGFRLDECLWKSEAEVAQVQVSVFGNHVPLGELFVVRISRHDSVSPQCRWSGNCSVLDSVGFEHQSGRMIVEGDVGNFCGACMKGGSIEVLGSAGHSLGGPVGARGVGMTGGLLIVRGSAGDDAGMRMRRGEILIAGDCGRGLGSLMVAGTIRCTGNVGPWAGYAMRRGTIILDLASNALPNGFSQPRRLQTPFLSVLVQHHASIGFIDRDKLDCGDWQVARGHFASRGQGEVWLKQLSLNNNDRILKSE